MSVWEFQMIHEVPLCLSFTSKLPPVRDKFFKKYISPRSLRKLAFNWLIKYSRGWSFAKFYNLTFSYLPPESTMTFTKESQRPSLWLLTVKNGPQARLSDSSNDITVHKNQYVYFQQKKSQWLCSNVFYNLRLFSQKRTNVTWERFQFLGKMPT